MPTFDFTEALIRENSSSQSYRRGSEYLRDGAVVSLVLRGETLSAEVEGSDISPYAVAVSFANGKPQTATCTCDYEYGGWCKHIVAVLLDVLKSPEDVETRTPTGDLLADKDADTLRGLLLELVAKHPDIAESVEFLATRGQKKKRSQNHSAAAPTAPVDPKPYEKRMKAIVRSALRQVDSYDYEDDPLNDIAAESGELLIEAQDYIEANDARNAVVILQAVTEGVSSDLDEIEQYSSGENEIFRELGEKWIETMLAGNWSETEKADWTKRLKKWDELLDDWGADGTFGAAAIALKQGWDFPPLVRVLAGESEDWEALFSNADEEETAHALAKTRIAILERQGRLQEAGNLARTAGLDTEYAGILIRLDRISEAADYAQKTLAENSAMLQIALLLADRNATAEAIAVGYAGLNLPDGPANVRVSYSPSYVSHPRRQLAEWLLHYARENGEPEIALQAGIVSLTAAPLLETWQKLPALAGDDWEELKMELLGNLLSRLVIYSYDGGQADIFLHEGLFAEAVALVKSVGGHELVERVADTALIHVPQDVLALSRDRAEKIMDAKKADRYPDAARWLRKAKKAYMTMDRAAEWQTYFLHLKSEHARKYTLMPLLNEL